MPLYDYKCTVCDHVHEALRPVSDRDDDIACPECFNISVKVVSSPAGINGGSHDGYRHRKRTGVWQKDMGPQGPIGKEWYGDNPHAPSTLDKLAK